MSEMLVAALHGVGDLRLESRLVPEPGLGEVLVQVASIGVCGSDVHYYTHGRIGEFVVDAPLVLGHESSGTIVAVGDGVDAARVGQRVSIEPQRSCRVCEQCKQGRYNLCPRMQFFATPPIDGAFAEFVVIQADYAFTIPDSMSFDAAALCEPLSVGIWACQKAAIAPGARVLIAGAGPIGIVTAQAARAFGAAEVIVSDIAAARRETALRFGVTQVLDPLADAAAQVDAFIDASGAAPAVRAGISAVAPGGRAVLVGLGADEMPLPVSLIQNRELLVTGVFRYANTWPLAIQLAGSGQVDLDGMVTASFGLAAAEEALLAAQRPETIKAIVRPGA